MKNRMIKKTWSFGGTMLVLLLMFGSCTEDEQPQASYPANEVYKQILLTNTTNFNSGFSTLADSILSDSTSRAGFCQSFLKNARFFEDNSGYLFVESMSGFNIAHPIKPEIQGTSSINQTDEYGNFIVREMMDIIYNVGFGFLTYEYNNPATQNVESKTSFVSAIPRSNWYGGAGFYSSAIEKEFYTEREMNEKLVMEAVNFMGTGIGDMLTEFETDSLGGVVRMRKFLRNIRFFEDHSGYFFVLDYRGYNVVQPPDPSREGNYQWDMQDSRGNYLMRGLIETAKNGGGFYSYYWMDYESNTEKLKNAYVIAIPGYDYLIGSGVYYPN
jgi:signal transduction histidine kinase